MKGSARTLAYVLGGGEGNRLFPLTRDRAKPAVPFGGHDRIIDFVLSNLYHSGIRKVIVLTQYQSDSLHKHLDEGWKLRFGLGGDQYLIDVPASKDEFGDWYKGTADAIYQKGKFIVRESPQVVNVFAGDHVYLMDVSQMNDFHLERNADLTISAIPVLKSQAANNFGVLAVDGDGRLLDFQEKPESPASMPGRPDYCLASMGNYTFNPSILLKILKRDAQKQTTSKSDAAKSPDTKSTHDFGYDVIPDMLRNNGVNIFAYDFSTNIVPGAVESERGFWRDIGSLDEFFRVNLQMRDTVPPLNMYNDRWLVNTNVEMQQPPKSVGTGSIDSIVGNGSIISHSNVVDSVISYGVRIKDGSDVRRSILLGYTDVGEGSVITNSIIDRGSPNNRQVIPPGTNIGVDKEEDKGRGFTISEEGINIVPRLSLIHI